jgi:hypothetical protein
VFTAEGGTKVPTLNHGWVLVGKRWRGSAQCFKEEGRVVSTVTPAFLGSSIGSPLPTPGFHGLGHGPCLLEITTKKGVRRVYSVPCQVVLLTPQGTPHPS